MYIEFKLPNITNPPELVKFIQDDISIDVHAWSQQHNFDYTLDHEKFLTTLRFDLDRAYSLWLLTWTGYHSSIKHEPTDRL